MSKFLAGLVVGIMLMAAVMRWVADEKAAAPAALVSATASGIAGTSAPPVAESFVASTPPAKVLSNAASRGSGPGTASPGKAVEPVPLHQYTIPVTEGIRKILDGDRAAKQMNPDAGGPSDWHDQLERESEDPGWSFYAETNFRQFFADAAPGVVLHAVICRQTICEVQATIPGSAGPHTWQRLSLALNEQPWRSEFTGQMAVTDNSDMLLLLQRNQGK